MAISFNSCVKKSPCLIALLVLISVALFHVPVYAGTTPPKKSSVKEEKYTVNFVDVDIATVANFISKITGKNFVYDERLSGKATIIAPSRLSADEAFDLFTSVLEIKGYTMVFTGNAYKIISSGGIKQGLIEVFKDQKGARVNESYIARLIPLEYVQSQDLMPILQPLISREGYMAPFVRGNALFVVDNGLNLEKILNIVKLLDIESRGYTPEIVYLKYAQAETMAQTLKQIKTGSKSPVTKAVGVAAPQDGSGPITDKRLNAIILYGSPEENAEYKRLLAILDVQPPEATSLVNVYYLENAEAVEIAKVLEGLSRLSAQAAGAQGAPPVTSELSGRFVITPDKATNSLIIMASSDDYQSIMKVIRKLDRRPRQVFVEAMITEVSINKSLDFGVKWRGTGLDKGKPIAIGGFGSIDATAAQGIISGMAGFTAGGFSKLVTIPMTKADGTTTQLTAPGFAALFSLSEFKDVIKVLSSPHILTSDNKEAEIVVGSNVPFLSKLEVGTAVNQPLIQSIERKDIGITLRIKPQISEGDYIKLDIYQEISAVDTTSKAADIITTKRFARTSVVVRDKQTIVIGGLIQDKDTKNETKVPLLGDIPILGWLFKTNSTVKEKTNLLVYLTPTIVKEFDNLDPIMQKKKDEFERGSGTFEEKVKKQDETGHEGHK